MATTPRDLGAYGRVLWRVIARQIADDGLEFDARELVLLAHACREHDMLAAIEAELATVGQLTVRGAQGQQVAHPLLGEARRSRAQVAALLKGIGLDDPDAGSGRGSNLTPALARRGAMSRHYGSQHGLGAG